MTIKDLIKHLSLVENTDQVRRQGNAYALSADKAVCAISCSGSDVSELVLDADAVQLSHIYLNGNAQLRSLRFEATLPHLSQIYLSACRLEDFVLPDCPQLTQLYAANNQLRTLRFSHNCPRLAVLDVAGNQLSTLDLSAGFEGLQYLYLNDNELEDLALAQDLPHLQIVSLPNNRLKAVPDVLGHLLVQKPRQIQALYLAGNTPKNIPPAFLGENSTDDCRESAQIWFRALSEGRPVPNKVVKLMLTGNSNAGKSTLLEALEHGKCPQDIHTTHGIQVKTLEIEDVSFNIWDFGGQEIYHGTHRLFMASPAVQAILFDQWTEQDAATGKRVKNRANNEQILNQELAYWYETTHELSPNSLFAIVQNKKDKEGYQKHHALDAYARQQQAKFVEISAKRGDDVDVLSFLLRKMARQLPEYDRLMPPSWIAVQAWFADNMALEANSQKLLPKADFYKKCRENAVPEFSKDLLLSYLHHTGFLYQHPNLGDTLIADQRWALDAIYKPLDPKSPHYDDFRAFNGKIRVEKIFEAFGTGYEEEEKWLFLDFMRSCGLCFRLNDKPWQSERDKSDIYVFPEFLNDEKPPIVSAFWAPHREALRLRFKMREWVNYYVIQSFIAQMGRKTPIEFIWRYGIHITRAADDQKALMAELNVSAKSLDVWIDRSAATAWVELLIEAMPVNRAAGQWEIMYEEGVFEAFDQEKWRESLAARLGADKELQMERTVGQGAEEKTLEGVFEDRKQALDCEVILFLSASPAAAKISFANEYVDIRGKLKGNTQLKGRWLIEDERDLRSSEWNDIIKRYQPSIIHFCGHCEAEHPEHPSLGGLVLISEDYGSTDLISAAVLEQFFKHIKEMPEEYRDIKLVYLNACFSEDQAKAISRAGMYSIGTSDEIHSIPARRCAAGFYTEWLMGKSIKNSLKNGKTEAILAKCSHIDELIHVFYQGEKMIVR